MTIYRPDTPARPLQESVRATSGSQLRSPSRPLSGTLFATLTAICCALWGSASAAEEPGEAGLDSELRALLAVLPGKYTGSLANAANPDREGQLFHTIEPIDLPEYGKRVFLHTLSLKGFDDPQPFQQKFYRFDLDADRERNRMTSVVMMRAPRWQAGTALDEEALIRFPAECAINWHRTGDDFVARVKRGDCVYKSAALGGDIIPDMTYVVTEESFAISDVLYRPDGSTVTPDNGLATAQRQQR